MYAVISKWGNSQGVRISKHLLDSLKLKVFDQVEIVAKKDEIIIKKPKIKHIKLAERLKNFKENYEFGETNWGEPVGQEIW